MKKKVSLLFFILILLSASNGLRAQQEIPVCPCCEEEYTQFDFWIGDWVVYAKGKMAGFNKITKIEDGCIIRENWKSIESAYTGSSYNFYDKSEKKWKQVWVDNQGTVLELTGEFKKGKMVLSSNEKTDQNGNKIINRITWSKNDDGTVRQLWEQSDDGGLTFNTSFDGLYRRRK
ncbi:MAG: hypothetical protein KAH17_06705 [Bacteroidales bacterium]|nr:hypothetical protein [Bacteroidales bacterium]